MPSKNHPGDDYTLAKVNDLIVLLLKDGISSFDPRDLDGNPYAAIETSNAPRKKTTWPNRRESTDGATHCRS